MTQAIRRLMVGLLIAFGGVALVAGYWSLIRPAGLLAREDNPRLVLAEQQVQRGQILDRDGVVLARTIFNGDEAQREYPVPAAAPAVGYYSLRYGTSGIENAQDPLLRGQTARTAWQQLWNDLLHRPSIGGDVRLTLDADVQQAAADALKGYHGAVVVVEVPSGNVLALSSAPTFDPNTLDENWDSLREDSDAPLLNRVTQGLYQPGASLQSVVLGSAINANIATVSDPALGGRSVSINSATLPCGLAEGDPPQTLADAFVEACPAPFEILGAQLGLDTLDTALTDFGLLESPEFPLAVESDGEAFIETDHSAAQLAVGQSQLTVTPLHMARIAAAFANQGQMPPLHLISATRLSEQSWQPMRVSSTPRGTISPVHADAIAEIMAEAVGRGSAQQAALPSRTVSGHAGLALTDVEGSLNAWFIGFVPLSDGGAYAVAVLLEDTPDAGEAAAIGGYVLQAALNAR